MLSHSRRHTAIHGKREDVTILVVDRHRHDELCRLLSERRDICDVRVLTIRHARHGPSVYRCVGTWMVHFRAAGWSGHNTIIVVVPHSYTRVPCGSAPLSTRGVGRSSAQGVRTIGTIVIVGGAFVAHRHRREATTDVDVAGGIDAAMTEAVAAVADRHGLEADWLDDRAKPWLPATFDPATCRAAFAHGDLEVLLPPVDTVVAGVHRCVSLGR